MSFEAADEPTELPTGTTTHPHLSGRFFIDGILDNFSWSGRYGTGATISYAVDDQLAATYGRGAVEHYKADIRAALNTWEAVANLHFVEAASSQTAKLSFTFESFNDGTLGLAETLINGQRTQTAQVVLDASYINNAGPGTDGFITLIHEVGHTLGIKHPHDEGIAESNFNFLQGVYDTNLYTVMSYNYPKASVTLQEYDVTDALDPSQNTDIYVKTPMIYDIATAQYIYGANTTYNNGDDIYTISANSGVTVPKYVVDEDGTEHTDMVESSEGFTIWDTGGNDTLVLVADNDDLGTRVDLEPFSNEDIQDYDFNFVGLTTFAIAEGVEIENVEGSEVADEIYGNPLTNFLYGGDGEDLISAREGGDVIYGGDGRYAPDDGGDLLYGDEGEDYVYGNGGDDEIYGGTGTYDPEDGSDLIVDGLGDDVVYGNGGDDYIVTGYGDDDIYGGAGDDTILVDSEGAGDTYVYGFENAQGGISYDVLTFYTSDTILSVDDILARMSLVAVEDAGPAPMSAVRITLDSDSFVYVIGEESLLTTQDISVI